MKQPTEITVYLPYINSTIYCQLGHDSELDPFLPVLKYKFTLNDLLVTGHIRAESRVIQDNLLQLKNEIADRLSKLLVLQLAKDLHGQP